MSLSTNTDYHHFLGTVKQEIQNAQLQASIQVNQALVLLYRTIGTMILHKQAEADRGEKIVPQLAKDLRRAFPSIKGFS